MDLFVVRHAIAFERDPSRWPNDADRPLTLEGEDRFRRAAAGLRTLVPTVDLMLASPFARAWRTAELLQEEAGWPIPERCEELEADRPGVGTLAPLRRHSSRASVALVGHQPSLGELASVLLAGSDDLVAIEIKKGGTLALGVSRDVRPGNAVLRWALSPKVLRSLAR